MNKLLSLAAGSMLGLSAFASGCNTRAVMDAIIYGDSEYTKSRTYSQEFVDNEVSGAVKGKPKIECYNIPKRNVYWCCHDSDKLKFSAGESHYDFSKSRVIGKVENVDSSRCLIMAFIRVDGKWWPKPYFGRQFTEIDSNGNFVANISTGTGDSKLDGVYLAVVTKSCATYGPYNFRTPDRPMGIDELPRAGLEKRVLASFILESNPVDEEIMKHWGKKK